VRYSSSACGMTRIFPWTLDRGEEQAVVALESAIGHLFTGNPQRIHGGNNAMTQTFPARLLQSKES
jgi:hypothetical protein